jgi:6-phosphogluconolactonase
MDAAASIVVATDAAEVVERADTWFRGAAAEAIAARGRFAVALSGGRTPNDLYRRLASDPAGAVDWNRVHLFWGDERCVPPDDPQSNYGTAMKAFAGAAIPSANVHRVPAEIEPPETGAARYAAELATFFAAGAGAPLAFDLVLLGLGPDGHTASLFPGSAALTETARTVVANWAPSQQAFRVTLTYPVLNAARQVLFLVTGSEKADIVARLLGDGDASLPAAGVRPGAGRLSFLLDAAAAAKLPPASYST